MPRRRGTNHILDSFHHLNATRVVKESIRVLLLHLTHFHSISVFLFSPLSVSLFISHFLTHHFPYLTPFTANLLRGYGPPPLLLELLLKASLRVIICFPSSITFLLLGKAATIQAVSDSYDGVGLDRRRILLRSGEAWFNLLQTSLCESIVVLCLWGVFAVSLATIPIILSACGLCSQIMGFQIVLGVLGVPFCLGFAYIVVLGNLAKVAAVLEPDCCGFKALVEANTVTVKRQQTALAVSLVGNMGFTIVELLFEVRVQRGFSFWEVSLLISMYSFMLVFDTVMNVVFYFACKI
ncbi:unnamed protein product [Linum tenue]|uniref:Uncharacterized protein n=1 Tax=Linum tenue TaxID=586396 RepID=A0AAV0HY56_9ROSI|nr:unnamed protein product [Linum tenue]